MQTRWFWCVLVLLSGACAPRMIQTVQHTVPTDAPPSIAPLSIQTPATFKGTLPCPDCDRRNVTLNLRPDSTFLLRLTYVGLPNGRDITFIDLGRWVVSGDNKQLTLHGGTSDPHELVIASKDSLYVVDTIGNRIEGCTSCALTRRVWVDPFAQPFQLWGLYVHEDQAGLFTEQYTGRQYRVAKRGDNRSLERAYAERAGRSGRPLYASVLGHFETMEDEHGQSQDILVVDRFEGLVTEAETAATPKAEAVLVEDGVTKSRLVKESERR